MARPLLVLAEAGRTATSSHAAGPVPLVLVLVATAAVATVVVSLCTSSKHAIKSKPWKQGRVRGGSPPAAPQLEDEEQSGGAGKKQLLASLSGIGSKKQLVASLSGVGGKVAKMVSWNRRSPPAAEADWSDAAADDGREEDEEALWKKAIIMGDKCRPLEFSGQIAYDADGNRLPPPVTSQNSKI